MRIVDLTNGGVSTQSHHVRPSPDGDISTNIWAFST